MDQLREGLRKLCRGLVKAGSPVRLISAAVKRRGAKGRRMAMMVAVSRKALESSVSGSCVGD